MDTQGLLTLGEAASHLRMLPARLSRLVKKGGVPYIALPDGEPRFSRLDLDAWVDSHKRPSEKAAAQ